MTSADEQREAIVRLLREALSLADQTGESLIAARIAEALNAANVDVTEP